MPAVDLELLQHVSRIHIESGLLNRLGPIVREVSPHGRIALFADGGVFGTHGKIACRSLASAEYDVLDHAVAPGEEHKNLKTVTELYQRLVDARFERHSPVVALGGGAVTDTVGFAAATYLRGLPLIQCPTTLLAMVDASVGGKVGVDLPEGKNLVGAFYQPKVIVIDTGTLHTLPPRQLRCGLAECVKHAVIRDIDLFNWQERHLEQIFSLEPDIMEQLVHRNVAIKVAVVMADEKENGERAHLNLGHTFAHAIEAVTGYTRYFHGEAVSLGMVAAARLSSRVGLCDKQSVDRIVQVLRKIGLPTSAPDLPPTDQLIEAMWLDKKVADGRLHFVLLNQIGGACIQSGVPQEAIVAACDSLRD